MLILFGQKYYGKDTSEVPSGFLIWIIEEYRNADWTLINACKLELSERLKFDWTQRKSDAIYLELAEAEIMKLHRSIIFLEKLICMAVICKGNQYILDGYLKSPKLLESDLQLIRNANQ